DVVLELFRELALVQGHHVNLDGSAFSSTHYSSDGEFSVLDLHIFNFVVVLVQFPFFHLKLFL
ncbi:hypothetical protein PENTCL1PPCAC_4656, partial [Pristionchus entomophagus]